MLLAFSEDDQTKIKYSAAIRPNVVSIVDKTESKPTHNTQKVIAADLGWSIDIQKTAQQAALIAVQNTSHNAYYVKLKVI